MERINIIRTLPAIALALVMFLSSCQQHGTSPNGTVTTSGNALCGTVEMRDEYRNKLTDCSGAIVNVTNGTSTYVDSVNADGSWEIADVPAGVFSVRASADGFSGLVLSDFCLRTNVQYVGSGTLEIQVLSLGKDISPGMIYDGTADVTWTYERDSHDSHIVDSTGVAAISFFTKNPTWKGYRVLLTESPSPTCSEFLAAGSGGVAASDRSVNNTLPLFYEAIRKKYGNSRPPLLYLQVRPIWSKKPDDLVPAVEQCSEPLVIPVQY